MQIKVTSLSKSEQRTYKIVDFFCRFTKNFAVKLLNANKKLKYLRYKVLFGERDSDIYVVSYPKSGTTIMQMMLYQMTTDGRMDFEHLNDVSPWIRNESFEDIPPRNLPSPRIIKSHDLYHQMDSDTKGKFIYVHRNGYDVAVSSFHQNKNYNNPSLNFEKHLKNFLKKSEYNWFNHTRDWQKNKNKLPVLFVKYEDLLTNFDKEMLRVATFCNIDLDTETMNRVRERCSFDFMKKHEHKFGIKEVKKPERVHNFMRKGKVGDAENYFSKEDKLAFNKRFHESTDKNTL